MSDFQAWAVGIQHRTEANLSALLPASSIAPQRLHEAMRYAALDGGKRVRPLLVFAAGEVFDADPALLSRAVFRRYPHKDTAALERALNGVADAAPRA